MTTWVGIDVAKETHWACALDARGRVQRCCTGRPGARSGPYPVLIRRCGRRSGVPAPTSCSGHGRRHPPRSRDAASARAPPLAGPPLDLGDTRSLTQRPRPASSQSERRPSTSFAIDRGRDDPAALASAPTCGVRQDRAAEVQRRRAFRGRRPPLGRDRRAGAPPRPAVSGYLPWCGTGRRELPVSETGSNSMIKPLAGLSPLLRGMWLTSPASQ